MNLSDALRPRGEGAQDAYDRDVQLYLDEMGELPDFDEPDMGLLADPFPDVHRYAYESRVKPSG